MATPLAAGRKAIRGFLAWWYAELVGMLPRRLRTAGRRERPRLALLIDESHARLFAAGNAGERLLSEAPLGQEAASELGRALRRVRRNRRRAAVRLTSGQGLRRTLDLPLAAQADLDQLLGFEMDRMTPFRADEVMFAHRVSAVDHGQRRLSVELELVPRPLAERALELARAIGLEPQRLELARADGSAGELDLLPRDAGPGGAGRLNRALLLLALALAGVALVLPLHQQRMTAADLEQEVAAARGGAERSMRLRQNLESMTEAAGFVGRHKATTPMVAQVLAELTRAIPDQAHVIQLQLRGGSLNLHGYADTASELIGRLSESPLFQAPEFRSPVTRDPRNNKERFHIEVQIKRGEG